MNSFKQAVVSALGRLLPERFKNSLLHLAFNLARAEFDRFSYYYNFAPNMEFGLRAAAKLGLSPRTIIDVGAYEGNWSAMARGIWPDSRLIMIEPNVAKQSHLEDVAKGLDATLLCELLGAQDDAVVPFNVMGTGSSVFNERSPLNRTVENRNLHRLDTILKDIEAPALLKIDTQGYELEVLRGSTSILANIDAILLEVAIIEINEGAPLLHDVLSYMKSIGFVTYDVMEMHRRPLDSALNQVDILFVRENAAMLRDKRHFR